MKYAWKTYCVGFWYMVACDVESGTPIGHVRVVGDGYMTSLGDYYHTLELAKAGIIERLRLKLKRRRKGLRAELDEINVALRAIKGEEV